MTQVILLVIAAAWAAVLIPPLLRSRAENRPHSSVIDFRNQLRSLQHAVPSRSVVPVRAMGRGLAQSPLSRPAAAGRPGQLRGRGTATPRAAMPARAAAPVRSGGRVGGPARVAGQTRAHGMPRSHGAPTGARPRPERQPAARQRPMRESAARRPVVAQRDALSKRRRMNVLFVLGLSTVCCLVLALSTKSAGFMWAFGAGILALLGYVYLLSQSAGDSSAPRQAAPRAAKARAPMQRRPEFADVPDDADFYEDDDVSREFARTSLRRYDHTGEIRRPAVRRSEARARRDARVEVESEWADDEWGADEFRPARQRQAQRTSRPAIRRGGLTPMAAFTEPSREHDVVVRPLRSANGRSANRRRYSEAG